MGRADNQLVATRHSSKFKGCNTMTICGCRTHAPLLIMAIQITHKQERDTHILSLHCSLDIRLLIKWCVTISIALVLLYPYWYSSWFLSKKVYNPILSIKLYPEWPHRQCVGLAFWSRTFAADLVQQVLWFSARIAVCNTRSSGGTALCRVGGATSQLDQPSLTPLSVAVVGWLQLGAPHRATSVITASSW